MREATLIPNTMEINDINKFAPPCMARVIEFQPPRTMVCRVIFGSTGNLLLTCFSLSLLSVILT